MSDPDLTPEGELDRLLDKELIRLGELREVKLPPSRVTRLLLVFVANDRSVFLKPKKPVAWDYQKEVDPLGMLESYEYGGVPGPKVSAAGYMLHQVALMLCEHFGLELDDLRAFYEENYL